MPKHRLISALQTLLNGEGPKILKAIPEAPFLVRELQEIRAEVTDNGYWKYGARRGQHDDLVLALAIAVWWLRRPDPMNISADVLRWASTPRGVGGQPRAFSMRAMDEN